VFVLIVGVCVGGVAMVFVLLVTLVVVARVLAP
jgi:hypothetical protein